MNDQQYFKRFSHFHRVDLNSIESFRVIKSFVKGKTTLDIGCGLGHLTNFWEAQGIDISEYAIKQAKILYPHNKFVRASASKLPFPAKSFEAIICYNVLEHLTQKQRQKAYLEIKRVLKKNGLFIAAYIDENYWLNRLLNLVRKDPTHLVSWSVNDFKKEIESQFKIIEMKKTSCYGRLSFLTSGLKGEIIYKCCYY